MFLIWLICASVLFTKIECIPNTTTESDSTGAYGDLEKLKTAEDTQKLEIIKQIKRINSDGSYTVGYEAEDGTFKIESRDVLGNVKGTYGYVDENGEIKRVSYVTNNSSVGVQSTTTEKPSTVDEVVHIPPRQNRSLLQTASTTRRPPSLAYLTNPSATTLRSNVIQPIPKRRILLSATDRPHFKNQYSSVTRQGDYLTSTSTRKTDPTTTIVYATSVPQKKTTNTQPVPSPGSTVRTIVDQNKGNKVEIADRFSKVHIEKHGQTSKEKPVTEESEEKERPTERKPLRGNFLRRQLSEDNQENFEAQQQVIYSQSTGEENSHIYSGITGAVRPLYSTTSSPRIPALVLAARSRAAQLQNTFTSTPQTTSTTEKVYSKPPRRKTERREDDEPTTEPTSEHNYITQSPIPVQIPANRDASQATEGDRVYKRPIAYLARSRDFVRQIPTNQYRQPVQQVYAQQQIDNEQYLRETTAPSDKETRSEYANGNPTPSAAGYLPGAENRPYLPPQHPSNGYDQQQSYPIPVPPFGAPYYGPGSGPQYYNNPDRPLTARDFERLLNLLILRHQQFQRYNYLPGGGSPYPFGGPGYNPYMPFNYYQQQIPRPPLYQPPFDPRYGQYNRLIPPNYYGPFSEQENMYQAQSPVGNKQAPYPPDQRFVPRRKLYDPQLIGPQAQYYGERPEYGDESQQQATQTDYLPPDVREELLYRMLMLAIQPESSNPVPTSETTNMIDYIKPSGTTTASTPAAKSKKPVRSVQILGEE